MASAGVVEPERVGQPRKLCGGWLAVSVENPRDLRRVNLGFARNLGGGLSADEQARLE